MIAISIAVHVVAIYHNPIYIVAAAVVRLLVVATPSTGQARIM
jgi:hypothetical protein